MADKIRAFIAIAIPSTVQKVVNDLQHDLQSTCPDVKWVDPKQAHLTLNFLGDIEKDKAQATILMMKQHLGRTKSFILELADAGAFPNTRKPQVLWIGIKDTSHALKELAGILSHQLQMFGFAKEDREFKAHITIGRVRSAKNIAALSKRILQVSVPPIEYPIAKVTLYKSSLTSDGPLYEEIHSVDLIPD